MSWFSKFLGMDKGIDAAKDMAEGIGGWIDEQQFTDEEKAKAKEKALNLWLEFVKLQRDENSIRSKARRILAIEILNVFLVSLIFYGLGYNSFKFVAEQLFYPALAVIGFYFGVHLLRAKQDTKMGD